MRVVPYHVAVRRRDVRANVKTCIALLAAAFVTTACSGYDPYNGFDGPPALSDLGFPDPGVQLTRISCSIWRSDGAEAVDLCAVLPAQIWAIRRRSDSDG